MSHNRDCIPSSPSPSSQSIDSSPSAIARVMAARTVLSTKQREFFGGFWAGFIVAVILFGIAGLSSIYVICSDYNPIDTHSSVIPNRDRPATTPRVCSTQSPFEKHESEMSGKLAGRRNRHLQWREVLPFLSLKVATKEEMVQRDQMKDDPSTKGKEELSLQPLLNPRHCLCHLISETLRDVLNSVNSNNRDEVEEKILPVSEEHYQQKLQALQQFPTAFTQEIPSMSPQQERLVRKMQENVLESVPDFERRASLVPWGGPPGTTTAVSYDWYSSKKAHRSPSTAPLDQIDGGNLFSSYLRIMGWPENSNETDFPFKLCKAKKKTEGIGCKTTVCIEHSLEFREKYMPWLVTPGIKRANSNGLVYTRGFSPPYSEYEDGGHAIVWLRLALKVKTDNENDSIFFVRSMIREFDRAVATSLQHSNGRVGKFNTVVDGTDFTWSSMPSISAVKTLVAILQDHFADRLGVVILTNIGTIGEILLKIFLPLITEEVRRKIVMLPHTEKERFQALEDVLGPKNIPKWLGGADEYVFDSDQYYAGDTLGLDEEAIEYLVTMPFHA